MEYYVNKRNGAKKILQQGCKIILIEDGIATDYAMNTLCAAGTGAFLSSQAKRLNVDVKEFGDIAIKSEEPTSIAARFTVFAESDLIHKLQMGYKKEDIIAWLCKSVALNYLNNVGKGKKIESPIIFQGGVSKNKGVKKSFEELIGKDILVDENWHLMGALGTAILALNSGIEKPFDFNVINTKFDTKATTCNCCPNNCEVISVKRDNRLINSWENRCVRGSVLWFFETKWLIIFMYFSFNKMKGESKYGKKRNWYITSSRRYRL